MTNQETMELIVKCLMDVFPSEITRIYYKHLSKLEISPEYSVILDYKGDLKIQRPFVANVTRTTEEINRQQNWFYYYLRDDPNARSNTKRNG